MLILGLNAYHGDSAAAILRDGRIVAAAEEEWFRRIKHWAGFPSEAIRYCLDEARVSLGNVDIVVVNSNPRASLLKKIEFTVREHPHLRFVRDRLRNQAKRHSIESELSSAFTDAPFKGKVDWTDSVTSRRPHGAPVAAP
ncbi:MAG: carbamoyltransferase N-terminal domain-containing protein [Candidatus Sulfotelmatobacter sp.]